MIEDHGGPVGTPLVVLSGVNKHFGHLHVLKDIDLTVHRGEIGRASCRERVFSSV